jgi:hypothetical protein
LLSWSRRKFDFVGNRESKPSKTILFTEKNEGLREAGRASPNNLKLPAHI